nr:hypothetical protein [Streptomyces sp. SID14515]
MAAPRIAVSGYLLQVERVAAADFRGREAELSELASFSTETRSEDVSGKNYWRWLAPAWAGKSALLADFVLRPPPGIDVVSFFITSRMAGQNDAAAFCEVVQRQLYALLREEEPLSTPHTRDEQMRLALNRTAEHCAAQGRRLVLVVDGLDEDHGITSGPGGHSIAALLPRTPPHGMRIIVAGRPHPPVPEDVPADHPLHTTEINHWLKPSPHAQAARRDAEEDLLRLRDAGGLGWDLVGLTVAAGGGLSASDIAALSGSRPRLVERELSAVSGRSFRRRSAHWTPDGPEVYLLAHEEIQRSAADLITAAELTDCRARLHRWAQTYRSAGWPATTPEYLLRGYAQRLRELGDTGRLVELVCDAERHERLWQVTGADLEALSELSASLDQLLSDGTRNGDVDVSAALRLAAARDGLHERTGALPRDLIGLWARLGHTDRAVSMAKSRHDPGTRVSALVAVALAFAASGQPARALELTYNVETFKDRDLLLAATAEGLAEAGRYTDALLMTSVVKDEERWTEALVAVVKTAAEADVRRQPEVRATVVQHAAEAVRAVDSAADTTHHPELYADLACAFSLLGEDGQAQAAMERALSSTADAEVFRQAQNLSFIAVRLAKAPRLAASAAEIALRSAELAATTTDLQEFAWLFPEVAAGLAAVGEHERAERIVERFLPDPADRDEELCAIATAIAESGDPDGALESAERIATPVFRSKALTAVGTAWAKAAQPTLCAHLAVRNLHAISQVSSPGWQVDLRVRLAESLLRAGRPELAEPVVAAATDLARVSRAPRGKVTPQIAVAGALISAGADDAAYALVRWAEESAEPEDGYARVLDMVEVVKGLHHTGRDDRKNALLASLLEETRQRLSISQYSHAMEKIAMAFGATGSPDRAREVAQELLYEARALDSPYQQSWHRYSAAGAFLAAGDIDEALALTTSLPEDIVHEFLSAVVAKLVETGDLNRAERLTEDSLGPGADEHGLGHLAAGTAAAGDLPRAIALLDEIFSPALRDRSTADVVQAAARAGATEATLALADSISEPDSRSEAIGAIAHSLGPTPTARLLLAKALSLGPWDQLVEAIAGVAPEQLPLLASLSRGER